MPNTFKVMFFALTFPKKWNDDIVDDNGPWLFIEASFIAGHVYKKGSSWSSIKEGVTASKAVEIRGAIKINFLS